MSAEFGDYQVFGDCQSKSRELLRLRLMLFNSILCDSDAPTRDRIFAMQDAVWELPGTLDGFSATFPQMFLPSGVGVISGSAAGGRERYKLNGHLPNGE